MSQWPLLRTLITALGNAEVPPHRPRSPDARIAKSANLWWRPIGEPSNGPVARERAGWGTRGVHASFKITAHRLTRNSTSAGRINSYGKSASFAPRIRSGQKFADPGAMDCSTGKVSRTCEDVSGSRATATASPGR